ncbi:MAG: hypothetical protein DLM67_12020 [Candidatus Nephthysia bennettiae]|uniref:Plasmid related protein n=1 Tax=Candidatus Aeolococcus gillhamiae TaxID=3127015 RepID=A0A934JUX6_9BACT|nr:hypothetical protein [Candidatus Dormibacteraeota bacterium]PZR94807.1 MAG: hypothetical protein DLM67_12020 [Candidatus Dormibacteraeota bacterium]PZS09135.1 MAG: hypothetical protein DLM70_01920 [Chloroflexota bacterium]
MAPFFPLGQVVATPGAIAVMEAARIDPAELLERHQSADWGDLEEEDRRENAFAVSRRLRIFSANGKPPDRLWVITDADRSVTTIPRPYEY